MTVLRATALLTYKYQHQFNESIQIIKKPHTKSRVRLFFGAQTIIGMQLIIDENRDVRAQHA